MDLLHLPKPLDPARVAVAIGKAQKPRQPCPTQIPPAHSGRPRAAPRRSDERRGGHEGCDVLRSGAVA